MLVVGLGREGVALATYLSQHGLAVTATDLQTEEKLGSTVTRLKAVGVSLALGHHPESLLDDADILFVSPGVPLEIPLLTRARQRGIPLSAESRLFCHLCPVPIMVVTGSSGKTTTTTLVGKIMEADGRQGQIWVGGNIGHPLIEFVDQISSGDVVIMELSSFQLEYFHARLNKNVDMLALPGKNPQQLAQLLNSWSPHIAAVLNITPNHLDRHPSMKQYVKAKRALIDYQTDNDVLVLGLDNDMTRTIGNQFEPGVRWFSLEAQVANGAGVHQGQLALIDQTGTPQPLAGVGDIKLRGQHNQQNILAACLLAQAAGASTEAMRQVIISFTGVEHRLQLVRDLNQVAYYNDSISTSPERLMAALRSFSEPIVLLAGGYDKYLPWEDAARLILMKGRRLILFGESAPIIEEALDEVRGELAQIITEEVHHCSGLAEAVQLAAHLAEPGNVVLLSPGCASYDSFRSFVERGEMFKTLVLEL